MNITSISAGTGPAAFVLAGLVLVLAGNSVGWVLMGIGGILSLFWALRFR